MHEARSTELGVPTRARERSVSSFFPPKSYRFTSFPSVSSCTAENSHVSRETCRVPFPPFSSFLYLFLNLRNNGKFCANAPTRFRLDFCEFFEIISNLKNHSNLLYPIGSIFLEYSKWWKIVVKRIQLPDSRFFSIQGRNNIVFDNFIFYPAS